MPAQAFEQGHFYISAKYTCKLACPYTLGMTAEGTGIQPKPSLLQGLNNNSWWLPGRGTGRLTLTTSKNNTSWRKASQHVEKKWLQDPITLRSLWTPTSRKTKDYSSKVRIMLWCFSESILLAGCGGEHQVAALQTLDTKIVGKPMTTRAETGMLKCLRWNCLITESWIVIYQEETDR